MLTTFSLNIFSSLFYGANNFLIVYCQLKNKTFGAVFLHTLILYTDYRLCYFDDVLHLTSHKIWIFIDFS